LIGVDVAFDGLRKKCGPKFLCKDLFVIFVYDNKLSTYFCTTLSLLQISVTIRLILLFSPNKKKEKNRRAVVSCLLCCFFESSYCYHLQNSYHRGSSFFTSVVFDPLWLIHDFAKTQAVSFSFSFQKADFLSSIGSFEEKKGWLATYSF
jgi:hypothetical protein